MKAKFKIITLLALLVGGCNDKTGKTNQLSFGVSSEYPPFEYLQNGKVVGFDIDIATAVAYEMGMTAEFKDMKFASILPAINSKIVDAGISAITITPERAQNYDFSDVYYTISLSAIYRDGLTITNKGDIEGKKVACQIGTSSEIWLKKHNIAGEITSFDGTNQAIEFLKSGRADAVIVDSEVAIKYVEKNPGYKSIIVEKDVDGFGIALKKGSLLLTKVNQAINSLKNKGSIDQIKTKWKIN